MTDIDMPHEEEEHEEVQEAEGQGERRRAKKRRRMRVTGKSVFLLGTLQRRGSKNRPRRRRTSR